MLDSGSLAFDIPEDEAIEVGADFGKRGTDITEVVVECREVSPESLGFPSRVLVVRDIDKAPSVLTALDVGRLLHELPISSSQCPEGKAPPPLEEP